MSRATESFIASRAADWTEFRRDLHRNPELGFTEIRTAARVETALRALGWTVRSGGEVFDATGLPVTGSVQTDSLVDQTLPKNELF